MEAVVQWHTQTVNTVLLETGSQKLDMLHAMITKHSGLLITIYNIL